MTESPSETQKIFQDVIPHLRTLIRVREIFRNLYIEAEHAPLVEAFPYEQNAVPKVRADAGRNNVHARWRIVLDFLVLAAEQELFEVAAIDQGVVLILAIGTVFDFVRYCRKYFSAERCFDVQTIT